MIIMVKSGHGAGKKCAMPAFGLFKYPDGLDPGSHYEFPELLIKSGDEAVHPDPKDQNPKGILSGRAVPEGYSG